MFTQIMSKVRSEVSGESALNYVEDISRFHRIQASPGFRQAAAYCKQVLESLGLATNVHDYRADGEATYWTHKSFEEWACESARLTLVSPHSEVLADFSSCPISLVQRSSPTPAGGLDAQLVEVKDAENPASYEGIDITGKIVLTNGDVNRIRRLAAERGAVGLVTDNINEFFPVRSRMDLPDARQYTSFWVRPGEKPFFGFVLSPRQGERIRKLMKDPEKPVMVKAEVRSRFYPGSYEVVDAKIAGSTEQEVWCVAHLCHPKPSANDNASGCGALMEAARVLSRLIHQGDLPLPRRTIRFLLVPEMTGTYCYLSSNEDLVSRVVAAVNLDMVGENQELCKGPLIIEKPPRATGSFAGELLSAIMNGLAGEARNLAGTHAYALFKHTISPFSGGSDHYILSDPSVGIPCPMIIQWPDKFYHTSEDTIDKVDPEMLARVATMVGTYLYFLASAGYPEAIYLSTLVVQDFEAEINRIVQSSFSESLARAKQSGSVNHASPGLELARRLQRAERQLEFAVACRREDLASIKRLLDPEEQESFENVLATLHSQMTAVVTHARYRLYNLYKSVAARTGESALAQQTTESRSEWDEKAEGIVPVRLFKGPVDTRSLYALLSAEDRDAWEQYLSRNPDAQRATVCMVYWADGKRNLKEIADMIDLEIGYRDIETMVRYYELLKKAGLME